MAVSGKLELTVGWTTAVQAEKLCRSSRAEAKCGMVTRQICGLLETLELIPRYFIGSIFCHVFKIIYIAMPHIF